jgi:hypothetical protein
MGMASFMSFANSQMQPKLVREQQVPLQLLLRCLGESLNVFPPPPSGPADAHDGCDAKQVRRYSCSKAEGELVGTFTWHAEFKVQKLSVNYYVTAGSMDMVDRSTTLNTVGLLRRG